MHCIIMDKKADDSLAIKAVEALIQVERFKREMRGIPSLKPIELKDAPQRQRRTARTQSIKPVTPKGISLPPEPSPPDQP